LAIRRKGEIDNMTELGNQPPTQDSNPTVEIGRPYMKDYGLDTTNLEGILKWEWISEHLLKAHNYWIASAQPNGKPHAMPVWGVWLEDTFYFSTGRQSRKGRNLVANPQVVVHLESGDEVVILEGIVREIKDIPLMEQIAKVYAAKYNGIETSTDPSSLENVVYALQHQVVYGWLESDFVNTATRWRFKYI
jgi:nitroimidazol reductase NimA-like FMN-containing flavoprotein (pyridoxamine 5'-phosphate oxidase superfamily)